MKHPKKKRSKASKNRRAGKVAAASSAGDKKDEQKVVDTLLEASISAQAASDPNKDGEAVESAEERSTTSSCFSGDVGSSSCTSTSEVFLEDHCLQNGARQKCKMKKVVASAGTVSALLGKDYVMSVPKMNSSRMKSSNGDFFSKDDAEQFLCSMFGEECGLSFALVRDVLCQCGYDVDKALNLLIELSASSSELFKNISSRAKVPLLTESSHNLTDRTYVTASLSSESDFQDSIWNTRNSCWNQFKFSAGTNGLSSPTPKILESQLPEEVLKSLFNMPTPKNAEHESNTMNWKNVVTKLASVGPKYESSPAKSSTYHYDHVKGDDYQVLREASRHHWESMKFCYQKAASAFTNGERQYSAYLSDQASSHNRKAREADKKASLDVFEARNKSIENVITIDLHGQHVKQAMKFLKLHLLFGAYVRSVRSFRVITGCGSRGVGKSKLKNSVINLLEKEGIEWGEENRGALLIKLHGQTNFSFIDSDSDSD